LKPSGSSTKTNTGWTTADPIRGAELPIALNAYWGRENYFLLFRFLFIYYIDKKETLIYIMGMIKTITTTDKMKNKKANKNRADNWNGMNWIRQTKRLSIYLRDGLSCAYCGESVESGIKLTLDHIIPYSKQGSNHESNLITACSTCNSARGNRPINDFIAVVGDFFKNIKSDDVFDHINECKDRKLNKGEAEEMVARRGSAAKALAEYTL